MYVMVNDKGIIEVYAEEDDVCYVCANMNNCPLMASLQDEITILRYDGMKIENCAMFEEFTADSLFADLAN
jgi:hypothetical protein